MTGDELKAVREAAGFSVKEFAEIANVDPRTIDRIEKDETTPSPAVTHKVQRVLKVLKDPEGSTAAEVAAVVKAGGPLPPNHPLVIMVRDIAARSEQTSQIAFNPITQQVQQQIAGTMQSVTASMLASLHNIFDAQNALNQQLAQVATSTTAAMANLTRLPSPSGLGLGDYMPLTASSPNFSFPSIREHIANAQSMEDSLQSTLVSALAAAKKAAGTLPDVDVLAQTVRNSIAVMGFDSISTAVAAMGVNRVQEAIIAMGADKAANFANVGGDSARQPTAIGPTKASEAVNNVLGGDASAIYSFPPAVRLMQLQAEIEQRRDENIVRRVVAGIGNQLGLASKNRSANSEGRMATLEARLKAYNELPAPSQEEQADVDPTRALMLWIAQSIREDTETELEQLRQRRAAVNPD